MPISIRRPSVFIASSLEAVAVAELVQKQLQTIAETILWRDDTAFLLSRSALDGLIHTAAKCDFAVAVLSPDDAVRSRGKQSRAPRANVVFELGFFMGHLGAERTFVIAERSLIANLFTDFRGINVAEYTDDEDPHIVEESVSKAVARIIAAIATTGARAKSIIPSVWAPYVSEGLLMVMPRYSLSRIPRFVNEMLFYRWKDTSGFIGFGDAMAHSELRSRLDEWQCESFDIKYADELSGEDLHSNCVLIGGPEANKRLRDILGYAPSTLQYQRDPWFPAIRDTATGEAYTPSFDSTRNVVKEYGVVHEMKNPLAPNRRMMTLFGSFGWGTWAAAAFATSAEFSQLTAAGSYASIECLVIADVVLDTVHNIRPVVVRRS